MFNYAFEDSHRIVIKTKGQSHLAKAASNSPPSAVGESKPHRTQGSLGPQECLPQTGS